MAESELALQFTEQLRHCRELASQCPRDDLVAKAVRSAERAISQLKSYSPGASATSKLPNEALQSYTQSILDSSYHRECQLVEGEFPSDVAKHEISEIIGCLCKPASLCGPVENIQPTLGTEQWECLNWRAGALLYMYVHNLMECPQKKAAADRQLFQDCCCVGVSHLRLMLSARTPLEEGEEFISHDSSLPLLLQQGIFSDVHMLGLMYAGELCYWAWEEGRKGKREGGEERLVAVEKKEEEKGEGESRKEKEGESTTRGESEVTAEHLSTEEVSPGGYVLPEFSSLLGHLMGGDFVHKQRCEFCPAVTGQELLGKYIEIARGPLKHQNWSYTRAVQLTVQLKRATSTS